MYSYYGLVCLSMQGVAWPGFMYLVTKCLVLETYLASAAKQQAAGQVYHCKPQKKLTKPF